MPIVHRLSAPVITGVPILFSFDQAQSQKGFNYDKEGAITRPGLDPAESRLGRHVCVQPVASPDLQLNAYHRHVLYLQRNCTLHNVIHSRQGGVGPGVGVGIGVDIKTPTPESESTPIKTLSTPQPCL